MRKHREGVRITLFNNTGGMMNRKLLGTVAMIGIMGTGLTLASCNGRDEPRPPGEMQDDMPMGQQEGMSGMHGMEGMHMEPGMMQRHAEEMDETTSRMRQHIQQMRQLSPEQQHERTGEHVTQVSQMLGLMNRQMREMDMGMGMSDEQMGRMMGMSGEEHRQMMEEMQAIRADLEQLQTASRAEVRERMPAHLDRLERMTQMLERSAEHMRGR